MLQPVNNRSRSIHGYHNDCSAEKWSKQDDCVANSLAKCPKRVQVQMTTNNFLLIWCNINRWLLSTLKLPVIQIESATGPPYGCSLLHAKAGSSHTNLFNSAILKVSQTMQGGHVQQLHLSNQFPPRNLPTDHCIPKMDIKILQLPEPSNKTVPEYADDLCSRALRRTLLYGENVLERKFIEGLHGLTRESTRLYSNSRKNVTDHDLRCHAPSLQIWQCQISQLLYTWLFCYSSSECNDVYSLTCILK